MKTLVIDRAGMGMGGIEANYANIMAYALSRDYRVCWLTTEAHERTSSFKTVTDDTRVEKHYVKRTPFGPLYPRLTFAPDEEVVVLTSDFLRYLISHAAFKKGSCRSFSHLLTVAHFKGFAIFPERCFDEGQMRRRWNGRLAVAASWLARTGSVVGFSRVHLETFEKNYGVPVADKDEKLIPPVFALERPDESQVRARAAGRTESFRIITCSRFDFPHKGYVLGLIRAFEQIHERHPQARLVVVGFGEGEACVREAVEKLAPACRGAVELAGSLAPDQLKERMAACHLNVGVAGALLRGAECALPSIVMRHYTEEFEGYGLFAEVGKKMSDEPGSDMTALVEGLITCSDDEYTAQSLAAFDKVDALFAANPEFVFEQPAIGAETAPVPALVARLLFGIRLGFEKLAHRSPFEDRDRG